VQLGVLGGKVKIKPSVKLGVLGLPGVASTLRSCATAEDGLAKTGG